MKDSFKEIFYVILFIKQIVNVVTYSCWLPTFTETERLFCQMKDEEMVYLKGLTTCHVPHREISRINDRIL